MNSNIQELLPNGIYHVYNRANGNEKLFLSGDNYSFFLKRYEKYMDEFLDTFCYCLMPNHFHLLVRVKSFDQIKLTHRSGLENLTGVSEMEKWKKIFLSLK